MITVLKNCRLSVTLRFLVTGESFRSLAISCRIAPNTIASIVKETLTAIVRRLGPVHLKVPSTEDEWTQISEEFLMRWGFPHCLGALDGKHISFHPSRSEGSTFYNYKGFHSLVLLALVHANKKFIFVEVVSNGRMSDVGVFSRSRLRTALIENTLKFPPSKPLLGRVIDVQHVVNADSAFPLLRRLMKPYQFHSANAIQRNFNKALSTARNVVEDAFGLLANRFRIFLAPIGVHDPKFVELIVLSCTTLHNMLLERSPTIYELMAHETQVNLPDYEGEPGPVNE